MIKGKMIMHKLYGEFPSEYSCAWTFAFRGPGESATPEFR